MTSSDFDLSILSPFGLLRVHSAIGDELRQRGLTRSGNNPVGDLAEALFCQAFGWELAPPSLAAADAVSSEGVRYQIKSRRLSSPNASRQLSAIRNLDRAGFDILAGVLFAADYSIQRAALIPIEVVRSQSRFQTHTNSALFFLREKVWEIAGVVDVTEPLRTFAEGWK